MYNSVQIYKIFLKAVSFSLFFFCRKIIMTTFAISFLLFPHKGIMADYMIIVAGGKGLRMGGEIPKQFLPLRGLPVLMRTLLRFYEYSSELRLVLVLPKSQQEYWRSLCREYGFPLPENVYGLDCLSQECRIAYGGVAYSIADGGETRFHSVQNGLALVPDDERGVVGVHDGVRPFVDVDVIRRCMDTARKTGAAVPVVPVVETLRRMEEQASVTVPRSDYRLVQTPQVFDIQLLKAANRQPYRESFTDDASVVEAYGHGVTLVEGNRENIKLTTPFDLLVAEALLSS